LRWSIPLVYKATMTDWDVRFIRLAKHFSTWSKDPSTQVGCVVVGPDREIRATGFNGFPRGVADTTERLHNRELKYPLICHGEENAILHAARIGVSLKGCSAYVFPWAPCSKCSRMIIQAGISRVVHAATPVPDRWRTDFDLGAGIMREAGIELVVLSVDSDES